MRPAQASSGPLQYPHSSGSQCFKRYPAYKDSGVEWLGDVPAHWEARRLKFVCRVNPGKSELEELPASTEVSFLPMEAISEDGETNLKQTQTLERVWQGYTYFRDGDVVVAKITPCFENGKGALCSGLLGGIGFGTTELDVLRPGHEVWPPFIFYLTKSQGFRSFGIASMQGAAGQQRITDEFVKDFRLSLPPIPEQRAIAGFLDHETAKIDALVAKKERLIELLQEKRQALISHAVTKGPDPTVPMKDSGVAWPLKCPKHWESVPIGRKITLQRGVDITKDEQKEGVVPVVSSGGISSFHDKALASGPGVVVGRKGTAGAVYYVEQDFWPHDTTLWVREFRDNLPRYVFYKLSTMDLSSFDTGSANPTLNRNLIHPVLVTWAPIGEQQSIVEFLDRESKRLDALIGKVSEGIDKVKEYRTALISAAVTGKIDVREEQISDAP